MLFDFRRSARTAALGLSALMTLSAQAALFEDEEARRAILDLRQRLEATNNALKAQSEDNAQLRRVLVDLQGQIDLMRADLNKSRGAQEQLTRVRRTATDFDMTEVEAILNKTPITDAVIRHWREKAGDRKTIVFCSTVAHAECVRQAFLDAGLPTVIVHGELSDAERKARLAEYESGAAQVVVNVAVLTEGYDNPAIECVVMARPTKSRCLYSQMVGRGTRLAPGKQNCLVLDFAGNVSRHGPIDLVRPIQPSA